MNGNLRAAILIAALTLAWNMFGFAGNFFEHYWGGARQPVAIPVVLISYLANALLLAAVATVIVGTTAAARALVLAGTVMAIWSLLGVAVEIGIDAGLLTRGVDTPPLNLPEPPSLVGALVPMITGAMTAVLAASALRRPGNEATAS